MKRFNTKHKCFVAVERSFPVLWCNINVDFGLIVTAEIKDGACEDFNETASSGIFNEGVASPIYRPEITEEEKRVGIFNHAYCARMDILYDVNGTGDVVSVLNRRFPMEITYNYQEKVDDDSGVLQEELSSATLSDETTEISG